MPLCPACQQPASKRNGHGKGIALALESL